MENWKDLMKKGPHPKVKGAIEKRSCIGCGIEIQTRGMRIECLLIGSVDDTPLQALSGLHQDRPHSPLKPQNRGRCRIFVCFLRVA